MEMFQSLGIADEIAKMVQRLDYLLLFHIYHSLHFNDYRVNFSSHIFVTSADSATFVVSMQTSNGSLSPKNSLKLIWGLTIAIIALLLQAGGLNALQIATIIAKTTIFYRSHSYGHFAL